MGWAEKDYDLPQKKNKKSNSTFLDRLCLIMKAFIFLISIACIGLNIMVMKEISTRFEKEYLELEEISQLVRDSIDQSETQLNEEEPASAVSLPITDVVPLLRLLISVEKGLRAPSDFVGKDKVVILGKTFILKRDFEIWEQTFANAGMEAVKTNKQELMEHKHDEWIGLKCLDLFDGKSHCIEPNELTTLQRYQKVSRLYGLRKTLWNKDRFCDTLSSALSGFGPAEELNSTRFLEFVFPCWLLPPMYDDLIKKARTIYKGSKFISKPTDRGEGNGINVLDSLQEIANWKQMYPDNDEIVVQTYLPNPLLINQRKWDMRTYVLVSSIHPLRVYFYRDGLVRFASSIYDPNAAKGGKKTAFLTNTSVNKKSGIDVEDLTWPFPKVYAYLKRHGINAALLWNRIERAVVQVLLSAEPAFARGFAKLQDDYSCVNCYQLLGVDVIVDDNLVPRVIELNGEPSMQLSGEKGSQYDITKTSMTRDLVKLIYSTDSFSKALAADLTKMELQGFSMGYEQLGTCNFAQTKNAKNAFCVRKIDLEYLLDMKREEQNMGGFRRIYPARDGDYYTEYIKHLDTKMPYGTQSATGNIHRLVTEVERVSTYYTNNHILDPEYFRRTGQSMDFEDAED